LSQSAVICTTDLRRRGIRPPSSAFNVEADLLHKYQQRNDLQFAHLKIAQGLARELLFLETLSREERSTKNQRPLRFPT
jgi:hypothetical protein